MRSLGRLRAEADHSWRTVWRGAIRVGPSRGQRRGFRALPLAVRVHLVQSAAGPTEKLQGSRVRVRGRHALNRRWDEPGEGERQLGRHSGLEACSFA